MARFIGGDKNCAQVFYFLDKLKQKNATYDDIIVKLKKWSTMND